MSEVMRRRRGSHKEKANHERWMISYADMLTLLLAFFILLWSAAKVNQSKLMEEAAGMLEAFEGRPPMLIPAPSSPRGIGHSAPNPVPRPLTSVHAPAEPAKAAKPILSRAEQARLGPILQAIKRLRHQLQRLLASEIAQGHISLSARPFSLRIRLNAQILFLSGEATLTAEARQLLAPLGDVLATLPRGYLVTVQGYTDDRPIRTAAFSSNWELSTARAVSVVRLFRARHVSGKSLSAEGFSKYRPVTDNDTSTGRSANRRVEILITAPKPTKGPSHGR